MTDIGRAAPSTTEQPGDWAAGWDDHRRRQFGAFLAATPAQRLAWLEEMIELAHRTGALPRPRPEDLPPR